MDADKRKKAVAIGMELFDTQQDMMEALSELIRAQIKMERALEGMTEEERTTVAADMVQGVKANIAVEEAAEEAANAIVHDGSTKH